MSALKLKLYSIMAVFFLACGVIGPLAPQPVLADHNPNHYCALIENMIRQGKAGGSFYLAGQRLTWSNGQTFAVFVNGVCQTIFSLDKNLSKAWDYVRRDAAAHGAVKISLARAKQYFQAFSNTIIIVPYGLLRYDCWGTDSKGRPVWLCPQVKS